MEELIKSISEKTGISADQAKTALNTVLGALKDKVPTSLGGQLEDLLAGKELNISRNKNCSCEDKTISFWR